MCERNRRLGGEKERVREVRGTERGRERGERKGKKKEKERDTEKERGKKSAYIPANMVTSI